MMRSEKKNCKNWKIGKKQDETFGLLFLTVTISKAKLILSFRTLEICPDLRKLFPVFMYLFSK